MCKFVFGDENFLFFVDKHSLLSLIESDSYKLIEAGMLKVNVNSVSRSQVVLGEIFSLY